MDSASYRLSFTLDPQDHAKGAGARLLLSASLDDAEPDARDIAALLDGIPGAYEHARESLKCSPEGATIALDEL